MKYRSKPQYVEAVQWDGTPDAILVLEEFCNGCFVVDETNPHAVMVAGRGGAQGWVDVPVGHWVVTDGSGDDYWPVAHDYFVAKYEPAGDE